MALTYIRARPKEAFLLCVDKSTSKPVVDLVVEPLEMTSMDLLSHYSNPEDFSDGVVSLPKKRVLAGVF